MKVDYDTLVTIGNNTFIKLHFRTIAISQIVEVQTKVDDYGVPYFLLTLTVGVPLVISVRKPLIGYSHELILDENACRIVNDLFF